MSNLDACRRAFAQALRDVAHLKSDALVDAFAKTVVQIGCGTGYYTAILAELVGPTGRVVAFEVDVSLAARAKANLNHLARVR